jgi:hypothetical protein
MPQKQVLAWWLTRRATAHRRWVSEQLGMGDESRVIYEIMAAWAICGDDCGCVPDAGPKTR